MLSFKLILFIRFLISEYSPQHYHHRRFRLDASGNSLVPAAHHAFGLSQSSGSWRRPKDRGLLERNWPGGYSPEGFVFLKS